MTILTQHQTKTYGPRKFREDGRNYQITAEVRYDDECKNGHNTFAITSETHLCDAKGNPVRLDSCGCQHDEVAKHFPELAPFIKWHLVSSDAPMHYVPNTLYWLGYDAQWCKGATNDPPRLDYARSTAVWPEMPEDMLATSCKYTREQVASILIDRRENLMHEFRQAVESLGFTF